MRQLVVLGITLVMALSTGCATIDRTDFMGDKAKLDIDEHRAWNVPLKVSFDMDTEGTYGTGQQTWLFGFIPIPGGDEAISEATDYLSDFQGMLLGPSGTADLPKLERIAAGRAIQAAYADGLYLTSIERRVEGFYPIWYTREVTVTGKPTTIIELGRVDEDEYTRARMVHWMLSADKGGIMLDRSGTSGGPNSLFDFLMGLTD